MLRQARSERQSVTLSASLGQAIDLEHFARARDEVFRWCRLDVVFARMRIPSVPFARRQDYDCAPSLVITWHPSGREARRQEHLPAWKWESPCRWHCSSIARSLICESSYNDFDRRRNQQSHTQFSMSKRCASQRPWRKRSPLALLLASSDRPLHPQHAHLLGTDMKLSPKWNQSAVHNSTPTYDELLCRCSFRQPTPPMFSFSLPLHQALVLKRLATTARSAGFSLTNFILRAHQSHTLTSITLFSPRACSSRAHFWYRPSILAPLFRAVLRRLLNTPAPISSSYLPIYCTRPSYFCAHT